MKKKLFFFLLSTTIYIYAYSQLENQQVIQVPTTAQGNLTNAALYLPPDYDSIKKFPLIIYLHGTGGAGTDITKLIEGGVSLCGRINDGTWIPQATNPKDGKQYEFIVFCPQAPEWSYQYIHLKYMLPVLLKKYNIDTTRIYITGISAGGYGVWTCITDDTSFCKKLAAIAPMSAAPVESYRVPSIKNARKFDVPVWNICGEDDSFWGAAKQYTDIIDTPDSVTIAKLTGLPKVGHWAWDYGYDPTWKKNNLNLYEWLLQFKRRPSKETDANQASADMLTPNACKGKRIYITKGSDNGKFINGNSFNYSPGDTLVLKSNQNPYSYFSLSNMHGTSSCPVFIINEGGQVKLSNGMAVSDCSYIKIDGTGNKNDKYGFYITDPVNGGVAIDIFGHSKNVEVNNISIDKKTYGFWVKEEAQCDLKYDYPNWTIDSIFIHDNLIENTNQEGMYMGSTSPNGDRLINCNGKWISPIPMRLGDINVYNNIVNNTKRAGIQLSGASVGINRIYNNKVSNTGGDGGLAQGAGIQLGGCTHAIVDNNTISNTYLPGIYSLGSGMIRIRNNTISNSGHLPNLTIPDMQGIAVDTRITKPTQEKTTFRIRNNTIINCTSSSDISIGQSYATYTATDNVICGNTTKGGSPATIKVALGVHWSDCSGKTNNALENDTSQTNIIAKAGNTIDLKQNTASLFPNPASTVLHVQLNANISGNALINIYDDKGALVQSQTVYKTTSSSIETINVQSLKPGLYILQVMNKQEKMVIKFIKTNN